MLKNDSISSQKIKQIFIIALILIFLGICFYNLSLFIPSILGAITLYIISRDFNEYLQEKKKWNANMVSLLIITIFLLVLVLPIYGTAHIMINKIGDNKENISKLGDFLQKIQSYIYTKTKFDLLSNENLQKIQTWAGRISSTILSGTLNTISIIASMFFILFFMLKNYKELEINISNAMPLKRMNKFLIWKKISKMVIANSIGIPVVALGQGIIALIGYIIFGAPNPLLLFVLTAITAMIPFVGGAIIYVPICIYLIAENQMTQGVGLLIYCLLVVGSIDNILRFTVLRKLEDIHPLITVFGIILGINIFGFIGLIFGPIFLSLIMLLLQVYHNEFSENK